MPATPDVGQAPLLTTAQVAKLFQVSEGTVRRMAAQRELQSVQIKRGMLRFRPEHVAEFLAARTTGA